jgi:hypothetical protein
MSVLNVVPIVEGHAEVASVTRLLERIWYSHLRNAEHLIRISKIVRCKRDQLLSPNNTETLVNKLDIASLTLQEMIRGRDDHLGLILILIDAEGDCPVTEAELLLGRADACRSDMEIAVVFANRMFENWFVASASSLAGLEGLPNQLTVPSDPEALNGSTWLSRQVRSVMRNRTYKKEQSARALVEKMDLQLAHDNSRSFRKLVKELRERVPAPPISEQPSSQDDTPSS